MDEKISKIVQFLSATCSKNDIKEYQAWIDEVGVFVSATSKLHFWSKIQTEKDFEKACLLFVVPALPFLLWLTSCFYFVLSYFFKQIIVLKEDYCVPDAT